jgi:hypothetical protein
MEVQDSEVIHLRSNKDIKMHKLLIGVIADVYLLCIILISIAQNKAKMLYTGRHIDSPSNHGNWGH